MTDWNTGNRRARPADRGAGGATKHTGAPGIDPPADPSALHSWFRRMRETTPVIRDEKLGTWHVFDYDGIARILTDSTTFSSDFASLLPAEASQTGSARGNFAAMDPPRHRRLRTLVTKAFTPRMIGQLAPRIRAVTHELLDALEDATRTDLMAAVAEPLPVIVLAKLLGIPAEDRPRFRRWADALLRETDNALAVLPDEKALQVQIALRKEKDDYLSAHIRRRRAATRSDPDLISELITAEVDGSRLDDEEIVGIVDLLLTAGYTAVTMLLGNTMMCLGTYPEAVAELRKDRAELPVMIEEVLRYRCPLPISLRLTTCDVEIGGHLIPAGQAVTGWIASGNRDERYFPEPDRFDIRRHPNAHLSFGHGIHFCLGAPLARLEVGIAMEVILSRWTELMIADGVECYDPRRINGPRRLPLQVEWAD